MINMHYHRIKENNGQENVNKWIKEVKITQ